MNQERDIIAAACDNRAAYATISSNITEDVLTDTGLLLMNIIGRYYDRDPAANHVDRATLTAQVAQTVSNPKHEETLRHVVDGVFERDVSGLNVAEAVVGAKRESLGTQLANAMLAGDHETGLKLMDDIKNLSVNMEEGGEDEAVTGWNPAEALAANMNETLIKVAPAALNNRLDGGLFPGHHLILFARPEMGKTSMLANMTAGFLMQDLKVLYCGNEDPIDDVRLRFLGRVIEWPRARVMDNMQEAYDIAVNTTNWCNLTTVQLTPGTPREIEALVQRFEPDVLLIDQLRNVVVAGNKSDGVVQHLEGAAKAIRQIGIRNKCVVVSVTQAGDSASGKGVLDMSDVDSSKTGIPAQADVMVGLGASREDESAGRRVLSLPKNKRSGRHEFFPVKVDFALGKFESLG